ncbi:MAG TPA: nuclear transport factor 2 family protein [Acidimicrobiales bacterium]|jgi:ketosteroid isomerase-like protein
MYHRIVAGKVQATFAQISTGNWEPMITGMAPRFSYTFYGDSALAGERHTIDGLRRWWERSFRLIKSPTFQVEEVIVSGGPWATRIATRVRVRATLVDGSDYENVFMQNMRMRWARITEIHTLEDTAALQRALDRVGASGINEALAPPVTDAAPGD